ncbi:MAG: histidinol-phosphatase [Bacteroidales bacterium]|jgi:histidinol-phosphatase (PHP family)|nr:histidinol-phosphatase [Bacteroidales bacterium]MCU0407399.1 histidinol-phosphatase [Bacteroidales bacterium]
MIYRTDYHIHTTFSDGRSSPSDYIPAALAAGLSEIGFSEHLTLFKDQEDWFMSGGSIPDYLDTIRNLKKITEGLSVRTGFEVDFFQGREKEIGEFLAGLPVDYIIGSVHYMGERTVDYGPEFYEGKSIDSLFTAYIDAVCDAAESGLFDIIGHCDLIRIYGYKPATDPEMHYRRLAKAMKKGNVAFEINTNGRNRPLADFYPDRRFIGIFREEGVPVCVNSDAHMPSRVGQYFDEAYDLLRYSGYNEMAVFENRKRRMIPF